MAVSMQNIITSIKNLDSFLKVSDLQGAVAVKKSNGQPFCYTGGFNMVFKLEHQKKNWAFRVWHVPFGEKKERFQIISDYLKEKKIPYFADFVYDTKGLLVNGVLQDTTRMLWLEGKLLKDFLRENLYDKEILLDFAGKFLQMLKTLHENRISHGDLQHGNILIDSDNNIKLVDYDSVCVPETEGEEEIISGLKGYQHPSRFENKKSSLVADYFSELIIYLSVLAIIENPDLWEKYQLEYSEYLLFSENDFQNLKSSEIYKDLQKLSPAIQNLLFVLDVYTRNTNYLTIQPIESYPFLDLNEATKEEILSFELDTPQPVMIQFSATKICALEGDNVELTWKVKNASKVYLFESSDDINLVLNNQLDLSVYKSVSPVGKVVKNLTKTTTFMIYSVPVQGSENQKDNLYQIVDINVFPQPQINNFSSSEEHIKQGQAVSLIWDIENAKKIYIWSGDVCNTVKNKDEITINLSRSAKYKLEVIALDGETKLEKEVEVFVHHKVQIIDFEVVYNDTARDEPPIKLRWNTMNASEVILKSSRDADKDVSNMKEIAINPTKNTKYWLEAKNKCFQAKSQKINIEVQTSIVKKMVDFFNK